MKRDKKKCIYSIVLSLLSLLISASTLEAVTLTVGSQSGLPGDTNILIPIDSKSAGEAVCSFNLDLNFDTARLSFKKVTLGPKATEAGKSLSSSRPSSDSVRVVVFGINQKIISDGTVLNFTFDILSSAPPGKAALVITNPSVSDCEAVLLPVTTENGEIVVEGEPLETTTSTTTNPTTVKTTTSTSIKYVPDTTTTVITSSTTTVETTSSITLTSSSTTTSVSQLWPLLYDEMWSNKKEQNLFLLRAFRDEVLLNTELGKEYLSLLYNNALEIAILLFLDPLAIKQASEITDELLHSIESLLYNDEMTVSQKTLDSFASLLDRLEARASHELKTTIKKVKEDIEEKTAFKQLEITIGE